MSLTKKNLLQDILPVALRSLHEKDVRQCTEIEQEAFPTQFPPTSFRRELKNRVANYLVAHPVPAENGDCELESEVPQWNEFKTFMGSLLSTARARIERGENEVDSKQGSDIVWGFIGTWYMVDEAHIVSLGVRKQYQGRGVGELLLIGAIQDALMRGAALLTLEVRPSNFIARNLYRKYGFEDRGSRKGYYADDREDAIIMTTPSIDGSLFQDSFRGLRAKYKKRWGGMDLIRT